jgi:glycerol-3-phosphate acyltransferase PlsY
VGDEIGAIAAGLGAVAGNVYNVWYRLRGGKGLGISLGVLAGLWPSVIVPVLVVILLAVLISRSSGIASLVAIAAIIVMAFLWSILEWPTGGAESGPRLMVLAVGIGLIIFWKHWRDAPFTALAHRESPGSG